MPAAALLMQLPAPHPQLPVYLLPAAQVEQDVERGVLQAGVVLRGPPHLPQGGQLLLQVRPRGSKTLNPRRSCVVAQSDRPRALGLRGLGLGLSVKGQPWV